VGWFEVVVMLGLGLGLMVWEFIVGCRSDDGARVVIYDHRTYAPSEIPASSVPREQRWLCGQ
jgi:hypothetical protein